MDFPEHRTPPGANVDPPPVPEDKAVANPARPAAAARLGRRQFVAGLAAGSLAIFGASRRARAGDGYGDRDAVKEWLRQIKELVCEVEALIGPDPGPLEDEALKEEVMWRIVEAAAIGQVLLSEPASLLYVSPRHWLFWMPPDLAGLNLAETATVACELACQALEEYCEGLDQEASRHLWECQQVYCHLFDLAGIER